MHEAVEDRVGQRRIPQGLMPVLDRQLTGHQRGPAIMAVFDDLQQVTPIFRTERRQSSVIKNEQGCLGGGVSIELITFTLLSESQWLHEAYQLN